MSNADYLAVAEEAARAAGAILDEWSERFTVTEKSRANLVTEADHASEKAIFELISSRFPTHGFLGEEGLSRVGDDPEFRWIIDPLDGTSNYVHRFPYYGVSIALEHAGQLIVGCIFDPNRNEMFTATLGNGSRLNNKPISTSNASELSEVMAMASLPVGADPDNESVDRFLHGLRHLQTVQRTGSAALNLTSVACGRIDAFWSTSLKPWDQAAGALIVEEAGGRVTRLDGSTFKVDEADLLATNNSAIQQGLTQLFT